MARHNLEVDSAVRWMLGHWHEKCVHRFSVSNWIQSKQGMNPNMLVRIAASEDLVKIDDIDQLIDPFDDSVKGRSQAGEEQQEIKLYAKNELTFLSGETFPRCWLDSTYKI